MTTWWELSLENRRAAHHLLTSGFLQSGISRSYYAVYCAVAGELAGKTTFGYGGNNPSHADLPNPILHNLTSLTLPERWEIRKITGDLFKLRVEADYAPGALWIEISR